MITIKNLSKSYEDILALDHVSLEIKAGELFGLIGPDGAGKSTLFHILTTLSKPGSGDAWLGRYHVVKDFKRIRNIVGYMPGQFALYRDLSVEENLHFFATIFGTSIRENYHLIEDIYYQIEPFKHRRAGALSGGMKQKLALSCALIHKPDYLLLDEPTTGVDPVARRDFWNILRGLKETGITIMVSTPYMDEAARCERVALIQNGKILDLNTPELLRQSFQRPLYSVKTDRDMYTLLNDLQNFESTETAYPFGEIIHLTFPTKAVAVEGLRRYLTGKGHQDIQIDRIDPDIEDHFMELMNQPRNEAYG